MSVRLLTAALQHSQAKLATRLVMLVLADSAQDDGVTWESQETLAGKALLSVRQVGRCVDELEAMGEIERRKVQRGRARITVYRCLLPGVAEVKYDRLPFTMADPFTTGQDVTSSLGDDRTSATVTTGHGARRNSKRARVGPVRGPVSGPRTTSSDATDLVPAKNGTAPARARNVVFDALAEATQADPKLEGGRIAKALKDIKGAVYGGDPTVTDDALAAEVHRRAALYRERWPGAELTPTALARNWTRVTTAPPVDRPKAKGMSAQDILDSADQLKAIER